MDTDSWLLFLAAYRAGSLSAAAAHAGLAQATLSRRIAALEAEVGHLLFDRTRRGLVPTDAAHTLLPHAEALAAAADAARAACDGLSVRAEGLVRLAAPESFGLDHLPDLLRVLAVRHPGVRLQLLADVQLVDLTARDADLALRSVRPTGGDLVVRKLDDEVVGLFASPALLARLPPDAALADVPIVSLTADAGRHAEGTAQLLGGRPPAFVSNRWLVVRAAAVAGAGAILTSAREAARCGLVPVPVALPPFPRFAFYLVIPRPLRAVPRVAAVVEALEEVLG
ncbi:MAG: LysR family transcriptional regulator [Myxococcota bacterium]